MSNHLDAIDPKTIGVTAATVAALPKRSYPAATDECGNEYPAGEYADHLDPKVQDAVYKARLLDPRPTYRTIVRCLNLQTPNHGQKAAEAATKRTGAKDYRRRDGAYVTIPAGTVTVKPAPKAPKATEGKAPAKPRKPRAPKAQTAA